MTTPDITALAVAILTVAAPIIGLIDAHKPEDPAEVRSWRRSRGWKAFLVVFLVAVCSGLAWYFLVRTKTVCITRTKPMVRIVLPWNPSKAQTTKGDEVAEKMDNLGVDHMLPKAPTEQLSDAPTAKSQVRFFFQANADFAKQLAKDLTSVLPKTAVAVDEDQNRVEGQFQACPGDVEFWLSSAE